MPCWVFSRGAGMLPNEKQFLLERRTGVVTQFGRRQLLSLKGMAHAMKVVRSVLELQGTSQLDAPPRGMVEVGGHRVTLTAGALSHSDGTALFGFRAYCRAPGVRATDDDVTLLYDQDNELTALYVGGALGELRTGAIGGLAIALAAPAQSRTCTVLGCGNQARSQALAACAALPELARILVWCRTPVRRKAFAHELRSQVLCEVIAVDDLKSAVAACDVLIGATSSEKSVIDVAWLPQQVHINAIGPKFERGSEFPAAVFKGADLIFTDFVQQYCADKGRLLLALADHQLECLGALLREAKHDASAWNRRSARTIFFSQGLASTELAVLDALLANRLYAEESMQ